jgi:hypothetical protein
MAKSTRPKTDYAIFAEQMRREEANLMDAIKNNGAVLINLPFDSQTIQPEEVQENARILYNAIHTAMGKPEVTKEEFSELVEKMRKDLGDSGGISFF